MDKWLDKLQDGAKFDGLTNQGFNYNGAWGGPAQSGKKLTVASKDDPRYKAYQDSLALHNLGEKVHRFNLADPKYTTKSKKTSRGYNSGEDELRMLSYRTGIIPTDFYENSLDSFYKKPKQEIEVKTPKYYDIKDVINSSTGGTSLYQTNSIEGLRDLGPGNTRTATPVYASGGGLKRSEDYGSKSHPYPSVSQSDFAGPHRSYPIPTEADAHDAEFLAKIHHKPGVLAKIHAKYPNLHKGKDGIITDEMGQWKYPGEVTRIPSNDITMEGVPYDVLGISDTGDKKLMKPGKNYKFKGKSVTEYPQLQNGKDLEQLLNFTNKPDKRWLDNL